MQSLRAVLLLVALSTTLFHLAYAANPQVTIPVVGSVTVPTDEAQKHLDDLDKQRKEEQNKLEGTATNVGGAVGNTYEDAKKTKVCVGGIGANCPASAISNLLSLAVVIVVGLFSRQPSGSFFSFTTSPLFSWRRRLNNARLTIKFRLEMQSLRAVLLLVALSTTLFHLAYAADPKVAAFGVTQTVPLAEMNQAGKDGKAAAEKGFGDTKDKANELTGAGAGEAKKLGAGAEKIGKDLFGSGSAISPLLPLAVVIVVGLFSRQ